MEICQGFFRRDSNSKWGMNPGGYLSSGVGLMLWVHGDTVIAVVRAAHICARSRQGKFTIRVKTVAKRLRRGLKEIAAWCRENMHSPVDKNGKP